MANISIRCAKASEADFNIVSILSGMLNDISDNQFPRGLDGQFIQDDPDYFDEDDSEHCRVFVKRVLALLAQEPSCLNRILMMAHCADYNGVFDPAKDYLDWHPALKEAVKERQRARVIEWAEASVEALPRIEWKRLDGSSFNVTFSGYTAGLYGRDANQGYVLRIDDRSGDVTHPALPPGAGLEPVFLKDGWFWINFDMEMPD